MTPALTKITDGAVSDHQAGEGPPAWEAVSIEKLPYTFSCVQSGPGWQSQLQQIQAVRKVEPVGLAGWHLLDRNQQWSQQV